MKDRCQLKLTGNYMSEPGNIIETQDGSHSIMSTTFGVSYHSKYGAIQESRHVFIEAGLYPAMADKDKLRVFEMGFGTGLNAYLSLLVAEKKAKNVFFETVESHPVPIEQAELLNYPSVLNKIGIGADAKDFISLHQSSWNKTIELSPFFSLLKWHKRIQDTPLNGGYDVVFYDAFSPSDQAELWEEEVISKVVNAMNPGGIFVTYCARGVFKRLLKSLGLKVEGIPGPPGKREMTRGFKL